MLTPSTVRGLGSPMAAAMSALLWTAPAPAQTTVYPLRALVQEAGKPPVRAPIGQLEIRPQQGASKGVFADFKLDPARGPWMDEWYDFRWIVVERFYIVNGQNRRQSRLHGPLPAIAPQSLGHPNGNDDDPFFHFWRDWARKQVGLTTIRKEGEFSSMSTSVQGEPPPASPGGKTEVHFETWLVAVPISAPQKANELLVLGGFEWIYETTVSSQGQQLHKTTVGMELAPAGGKTRIDAALANAAPAFKKPSKATAGWTAVTGLPLVQCPRRFGLGTQPNTGAPAGHYAVASGNGVSPNDPGGVFLLDPTGARAPVAVQGLSAGLTGQGGPVGLGASAIAATGAGSEVLYVGTVALPTQAAPRNRAELHRVEIDVRGNVIRDDVVDSFGPGTGTDPIGYVAIETVPCAPGTATEAGGSGGGRCGEEPDDCVCGCDREDLDNTSPLRYFDAGTGQANDIPILGALPQGTLRDIAVDATGSTVYMAYVHVDGSGIATGTGEIVSVPIGGGMVENVAMLPFLPETMETDGRDNTLHLTGFDAGALATRYDRVDPFTGTVTPVSTLTSGGFRSAFEHATGEVVLVGIDLLRLAADGTETKVRSLFGNGVGFPNDVAVIPSPQTYGVGSPATFGAFWDLPPRRPGGGLADLPVEGNRSFAVSLSTSGWPITGAIGIALGRTPRPGVPVLGASLLLDPATTMVWAPVVGAPTAVLPLPIPDGAGPASLFLQLFFLDRQNLGASAGLKLTVIED